MERLRNNFFNGGDSQNSKITWVAWAKVLSSKKNGGLGVSSFFALNRALLLKWDGSVTLVKLFSWGVILRESSPPALESFDFLPISKIPYWGSKWGAPSRYDDSFRTGQERIERNQWTELLSLLVNIFAWRASLDRLPTRGNLISRGVTMDSPLCPICELTLEDSSHLFFSCDLGKNISQRICRWWNIQREEVSSFVDWLVFDSSPPRRSVIFDELVAASFNCKKEVKMPWLIAFNGKSGYSAKNTDEDVTKGIDCHGLTAIITAIKQG
ncbi:RNA-directed DNA polymerase, eukaryota [Tanacetum coccineum]